MTTEIITLNEGANNGSLIHLYYNAEIGLWMAFGYSAYGLRLFSKSHGHGYPRCFSSKIQMPCTVTDNDGAILLMKLAKYIDKQTDDYICVHMENSIDVGTYNKWTDKLKNIEPISTFEIDHKGNTKDIPHTEAYIKDSMSSFGRNFKRICDMILSFFCLIIFSPLILICWIAVKIEDGGPAIYKQERIGRFGRPFYIYKFRSMRIDAEKMGPQLSSSGGENDTRLTKVGKFIRAHHLDELPQLWNVFCGDMAFVGPRPERQFYIDQILEHDKRYTYLYQIRPGVTSYATLYNGYTDTIEKMLRRLEYDLYYLGHRSWFFDMKILFMTFCSIVFGKKF